MTDTRDSFVNVRPVIVADTPDAHQVWLDIGVQHFTIGEYCETKDEAEWLAAQLRIALTALQAGAGDVALPLDEYHEDMGPVTWWSFPIREASWIGSPNDSDWPEYHTHFTPHPRIPEDPTNGHR
jgi:hypothetical protein